jgi:mannitol 2-dehydrogenase
MVTLKQANLGKLPKDVAGPAYQRSRLSPGIVHFGVGNFHRAHQAVYLDRLMNEGAAYEWAIVGVGTRPDDRAVHQALKGQDWLTTVVEQSAERSAARVTGPMIDMILPGETRAILARLADPATRIVSMTVTEGGYFVDPATGRFDPANPEIAADAANPQDPKTVFGLVLAGLERRRAAGLPPFTVSTCDNLPHNGDVTRAAVTGLAALRDPQLADWVLAEVAFPNGMVDRITPATGQRERDIARTEFGIDDAWPVFCEDFIQWVLEDKFPLGRPPLERAGVQFVPDVAPFELMKLRILNGGHAAIAYPSALLDIHFVHEAMATPLVSAFLRKLETEEIIPVVPPVPGTDLQDYFALIERRFANPKIGDTIARLCQDGSNRQPKFILPTARDRLARGLPLTGLPLVSALWCRYCALTTDSGRETAPNDESWQRLRTAALAAKEQPGAFLALTDIFGELGQAPAFVAGFARALASLWQDGTRRTLERYLANELHT